MIGRRLALLACALAAAVALALPSAAAAATPQTSLNDIEDEVMCVVCGVPLNIAESPQADRQRVLINELVAEGRSKDQIKAALVRQYGQAVLADPGGGGIATASWLVPVLIVAGLLGTAAVLAPRWRRRQRVAAAAGPDEAAPPALDPDDARRLDEDLERFR